MMDAKYDPKLHEQKMQALWEQEQTYSAKNNPGKLYSIDTPPPTVSGSLHLGHIFSYTQTDIVARYKRMSGFSVFYPFGFDDNGLPTEKFVEKKHNVRAHELKRSDFIKLCLQETHLVEEQFKDLWRRIGLSADWNLSYSTISDSVRKISQESFIRLYKKGYIYRTFEPALYCTTCYTSVAQAELDDAQKASTFNDIVFTLEDGTKLTIGTTRPELLPSCVALFYHPSDERYKKYAGQQAIVPLFNVEVPIMADELVNPEKGTGLVMCCTFGDKTDIIWYKKYRLPYKQSIGLDGRFMPNTGILAGLKPHQAREKVLEELQKAGLLVAQKPITHNVNVHERCKKEIEYVNLAQWFIDILSHKKTFLKLGEQINWYPTFMKSRYINWVENLGWNWCISRQRFFGIPFPVWHCTKCNEILLASEQDLPIDPQETRYPGTQCPTCQSTDIVPDKDVMDTWNTSSLTPYICYSLFDRSQSSVFSLEALKEFIPMSMRPQAHDIIRTWAFYTIIKTWMHSETIPWKDIVISGHVLSDAKEKLSKSKENNKLAPETLIDTYSADVVRYWTASGSLGQDVPFSENQLKIGQRLVTKLWNAFRFVGEHTQQVTHDKQPTQLGAINEWLLHQVSMAFSRYKHHFDAHEFGHALHSIEQFFWHDFCDNYLELVKNQLFNPQEYAQELVEATKWTLYHVGLRILQFYAPYLPHITDTIYQDLYKKHGAKSLHQTQLKHIQKQFAFAESAHALNSTISVVEEIRKLKSEHELSLKAPLATLTIHVAGPELQKLLQPHEQLLKGVTHAQKIMYTQKKLEKSALHTDNGEWFAEVIAQLDAEKATKVIEK